MPSKCFNLQHMQFSNMNIGKITLTYFEVILLFCSFSSKEILRDAPLFEVNGNAYLIIFLYTKFPDPKQKKFPFLLELSNLKAKILLSSKK